MQLTLDVKDIPEGGSSAIISSCGNYRYSLSRIWDKSKPTVLFVMLNPSTADELENDNTINRCIGFAKSWGYGGLYVANLFSYRSRNPKALLNTKDPFGEKNESTLYRLQEECEIVVCAWGNYPIVNKILKGKDPLDFYVFDKEKLHYLKLSKNGTPTHPLYLKSSLVPIKFNI